GSRRSPRRDTRGHQRPYSSDIRRSDSGPACAGYERWPARMKLRHVRLSLAEANSFVAKHHRHHRGVVGHLFSIGAVLGEAVVGVVIVGRPVARLRDDGETAEVTRLCTDGTRNACSFLYGAATRAAFALGYRR